MLLSQCLHWGSYFKEAGGYILKHSVGSIPHKTEEDVPFCFTDDHVEHCFLISADFK
jgi:hypothetical protein